MQVINFELEGVRHSVVNIVATSLLANVKIILTENASKTAILKIIKATTTISIIVIIAIATVIITITTFITITTITIVIIIVTIVAIKAITTTTTIQTTILAYLILAALNFTTLN